MEGLQVKTPWVIQIEATQAALTAALDYLWVVVEHNRLHFGDSHNTVIQGKAAIAQIEALGVK